MNPKKGLARLATPLALASYLAWLAVWVAVSGLGPAPGEGLGWPADALLLAFLAIWLVLLLSEEPKQSGKLSREDVLILALSIIALGLISLGRSGTSPILLILAASALADRFSPRGMILAMLAINSAFAAILLLRWQLPLPWALPTLVAYVAFQMFAVLVLRYAEASKRMAEQLMQVNAQLLSTRALLSEAARDQERLRLSRELHDVAGHKLTALKLNLRSLNNHPELKDCPELDTSARLAGELLDELRALASQLRQHDGIDLTTGIRQLAEPLPRPQLHLEIKPELRIPRTDQAEVILRTVQEGLTNAARHSNATDAWLKLYREQGSQQGRQQDNLVLEFTDNGRLDGELVPGDGLTGMRERIEALDGELQLRTNMRGGLELTARLPMAPMT